MDLTYATGRDLFNVRVAVVIVARGRLLLQGVRAWGGFFVPPGGRCQFQEPTADAAARELREELGRDVAVGPLLWLVENFFDHDGRCVHEYTFVYAAALPDDDPLIGRDGDFDGPEVDPATFFRWVPLAELADLEVYPQVLRTRSADLPTRTEHLVVDQREASSRRVAARAAPEA